MASTKINTMSDMLYFYRIKIDRVVDGDTVDALFDVGFDLQKKVRIRMYDYDAPETWKPTTPKELEAGEKVHVYLQSLLSSIPDVEYYCRSINLDMYGRSLGEIFYKAKKSTEFININGLVKQWMIDNHLTKVEARTI